MPEMTLSRLENYYIIANQIEAIKTEYMPSYISAVNNWKTAKVSRLEKRLLEWREVKK